MGRLAGHGVAMSDPILSEHAVALAVAEGALPSPSEHCGSHFFRVRVSGTGVSYRKSRDEFVYRPPEVWLSDEMISRCTGMPVVVSHPPSGTLTGDTLAESIVGTIIHCWVQDDSLMGVARIIDADAARAMAALDLDTSPSVVLRDQDNITLEIGGGDKLLIEDSPLLCDHLAIVEKGVWSKGGAPGGLEVTS
jgi:Uncharacterized protein conserved in bacteria (DUF2213)